MELLLHERHGVVSAADARKVGLDASELRRMVRRGQLLRLIRGWYAVWPPGADRPPWEGADRYETARLSHRLLTAALLRSFAGRVVASHHSALVLHGVRLWRSDLDTAHVSRTEGDHTRHRPRAVIHPAAPLPSVTTGAGLSTVPAAVAVVQVGLRSVGPGLPAFPLESLVAADGALHDRLVTPEELQQAVELHAGHPGIPAVRRLLAHADGRHESVGETRLAHAMRLLGYAFTPQVPVWTAGRRWWVDFMLDEHPVVVEFDGLAKYADGATSPSAEQLREALAAEKYRQDRIREARHEFARFMWADLDDLDLIRARVDAAILRTGLARPARGA